LAPHAPGDFALKAALLDLSKRGKKIAGAYRPRGTVARTVEVDAPAGSTIAGASANGQAVTVPAGAASGALTVQGGVEWGWEGDVGGASPRRRGRTPSPPSAAHQVRRSPDLPVAQVAPYREGR